MQHKRQNGVGTIERSHRFLRLTIPSTTFLATDVASQLHPKGLRHGTQGGVNIPARCPLGFARTKPTVGRRHSVSDVYLSRIFDLKCLPCDWCFLLGGWSHLRPRSQVTGLLATDTKTLSNSAAGKIKFLAACWIGWSVSQQRILGRMSDLLSATTVLLAKRGRTIHAGSGTNTPQKPFNQSKNTYGIIEFLD